MTWSTVGCSRVDSLLLHYTLTFIFSPLSVFDGETMLTAGAGPPPATDCAGAVQRCHVLAAGARVYPHSEVAPWYTLHLII